jgi:hypothetical protein
MNKVDHRISFSGEKCLKLIIPTLFVIVACTKKDCCYRPERFLRCYSWCLKFLLPDRCDVRTRHRIARVHLCDTKMCFRIDLHMMNNDSSIQFTRTRCGRIS